MVKGTFGIEDRVFSYDEDSISCTSPRFDALQCIDWEDLYKNMIHFDIDASHMGSEYLDPCFDEIDPYLENFGFQRSDRIDFYIALSEALHNAQSHTLRTKVGEKVSFNLLLSRNIVFAGITARGQEYNIQKAVESIRSVQTDLKREHGRGGFIMATTCDLFYVSKDGIDSEVILGKLAA